MHRVRIAAVGLLAAAAAGAGTVVAAPGLTIAAPAPAGALTWPACVARTAPVRIGLREIARQRHGRLLTLALRSDAMGDVQHVDVLLPRGYERSPSTRYHVLVLLHGAGGDYRSWMATGAQRLLGALPVIAVMPGGTLPGQDGGYTDWAFHAPGEAAPAWETFHMRELMPFIDRSFRVIPGPSGHAVAGISMGGGGATKYAAQYPGTFGYAATFSGEADPLLPVALAYQPKNCRWGDPVRHAALWRGNDSTDLAGNLRGVRVFIRSGNGTPGPFDRPVPAPDTIARIVWGVRLVVEYGAHLENRDLLAALRRARVSVDARFFDGSHYLPYWQRDTRELVAWLRAQFRTAVRAPRVIRVRSVAPWWRAWGWTFAVTRRATEFLYVTASGAGRLMLRGSGRVVVSTPAAYRPEARYAVAVGGRAPVLVRASPAGVLRFSVSLGPAHRHDQTRFGPGATRGWRTVSVAVSAPGRG